jgi:TATA-box binding protein (TBP) (component of TFIID and TFIIIB)
MSRLQSLTAFLIYFCGKAICVQAASSQDMKQVAALKGSEFLRVTQHAAMLDW